MVFIELTKVISGFVRVNAASITSIETLPGASVVVTANDVLHVRETPDQIEELIEQAEDAYNRKVLELSTDVATSGAFDFTMKAAGLE